MNTSHYTKIVHAALWHDNKILLSQVRKSGWHQGLWGNPGGKVEANESLISAVQREVAEETGLYLIDRAFNLIDCYIFSERCLKTFLYEVKLTPSGFVQIKNTEPNKQGPWQLFTREEALRLPLMPSLIYYLRDYSLNEHGS